MIVNKLRINKIIIQGYNELATQPVKLPEKHRKPEAAKRVSLIQTPPRAGFFIATFSRNDVLQCQKVVV